MCSSDLRFADDPHSVPFSPAAIRTPPTSVSIAAVRRLYDVLDAHRSISSTAAGRSVGA